MEPTVSIIMPVYGAEATLERCLRSIQAQTLTDWEVIAVDDGSPDRSGALLDRAAAADPRIRVVHQPNGGVASARQAGLDQATGAYAIHVDPDDWVEPDMLETLVDEARRTGADMVVCDYFSDIGGVSTRIIQRPGALTARALTLDMFQQLHGSCCNKLISSACYTREHFEPGLNLSEDLLYICRLLTHNPKIAYVPHAFYHYVYASGGSMSSTYTAARFRQLRDVYCRLESLYTDDPELTGLILDRKAAYLGNTGACAPDLGSRELRQALGPGARRRIWRSPASLPRRLLILSALSGLKPLVTALLHVDRKLHNK